METIATSEFESFLNRHRHSQQTIRSYVYAATKLLSADSFATQFDHRQIIAYIGEASKGNKPTTNIAMLAGIKRFYDFLLESGARPDHPCRTLYIKEKSDRRIIHQDLFSSDELALLLEREERYEALRLKNQCVISFLIFQAMSAGEIVELKLHHVNFSEGTIYVKGSRTRTSRCLVIAEEQLPILHEYVHAWRDQTNRTDASTLIIGKLGTPVTIDDINYLVSTFKPLFPGRNLNAITIRQSVIANWLNEYHLPLEQVQLMAGHKWISTTERYRQESLEELREAVNKWHPLNGGK